MVIWQARSAQDETQRMTAVRKAYQKAIVTPNHHVEQLWKDYENFENSVSRVLVTFNPLLISVYVLQQSRKMCSVSIRHCVMYTFFRFLISFI